MAQSMLNGQKNIHLRLVIFFWSWDFPIKDMVLDESRILVNGKESPHTSSMSSLVDGYHYRAEFTSKDYDASKDADFMPPDL